MARFALALRVLAVLANLASGLARFFESPGELATLGASGLAPEVLGLYGAVQIVCALLVLGRRTRAASGVVLIVIHAMFAWLLLETGRTAPAIQSAALSLLTTAALFMPAFAPRR